jgi:hypothetical protein
VVDPACEVVAPGVIVHNEFKRLSPAETTTRSRLYKRHGRTSDIKRIAHFAPRKLIAILTCRPPMIGEPICLDIDATLPQFTDARNVARKLL